LRHFTDGFVDVQEVGRSVGEPLPVLCTHFVDGMCIYQVFKIMYII